MVDEVEIGKCTCNHAAISYHGIDRHFKRLIDGKQVYSDLCQEPECHCERARLSPQQTKWTKVVAEVMG